jgi:hypothetical protein
MCNVLAASMLRFDGLTVFGLVAVSLMLLFYAIEQRSPAFVLAFAGACVMGSVNGFLQGAWPFGLVEGVWSVVAVRRWRVERIRARLAAKRWRIGGGDDDDDKRGGGGGRGPRGPRPGKNDPGQNMSLTWLAERL